MQIVNLMTRAPIVIDADDTLANAKSAMNAGGFTHLPVVADGRLIGILTDRDLRVYTGYLGSTRVNAAMQTGLITVTPHNTVEDAAQLMLNNGISCLPVVADGELVGMVTSNDLLKAFLAVVKATEHVMDG